MIEILINLRECIFPPLVLSCEHDMVPTIVAFRCLFLSVTLLSTSSRTLGARAWCGLRLPQSVHPRLLNLGFHNGRRSTCPWMGPPAGPGIQQALNAHVPIASHIQQQKRYREVMAD